jgi:O-antigen/teichoic acid export membrane protein
MKPDNKYLKSLAVLFSGSLIAQGISILFAPIMTRAFSAENLGVYTYLLSITTMFMPVVNLRYDMSIVSLKEEEEIFPLIKGSLIVGGLVSVVTTVGYGLFVMFSNNNKLYMTIPFFFLIVFSYSLINVFTAYNNKEKNYGLISKVSVIRSVFQNGLAAVAGFLYNGVIVLLLFYSIGQFAGIKAQMKSLTSYLKVIGEIPIEKVKYILKREYKQPLYSTPAIFFNGLAYALVTILMERLYDFSTVGFYSISVRMLGIPIALIAGNVSKVFFERATAVYHEESNFRKEFKQTFLLLLIIAVPMTLFLMVFSPLLFSIFFGEEWRIAGEYVVILAPMFGIRFIVTTVSPALIIVGKQRIEFFLQLSFLISIVGIYLFAAFNKTDVLTFLRLISLFFSLSYLGYLWFINKFSKGER